MKREHFLLILITFLMYLNSFGNCFVWDDLNNIVDNEALNEPVRLKNIFLCLTGFKTFYPATARSDGYISLALAHDQGFNHTLYAEVLREFVDGGKVDYAALKNNHSTLDKYLNAVAVLDNNALNSMSRNEKIAFYLNIYNALTLKVIVDYYPVKSIKDIPGVWDKIKFKVAGREFTLNQIEHQILRKEFKEPRIHFALVCASKGCPKLAKEPFSGKELDKQLDSETRKFINDETKVKLDRNNGVLYISSIFKWFSEDFGDVIKFISKYLPEKTAEFIEKTKPKIQYINYDWSLNEKL